MKAVGNLLTNSANWRGGGVVEGEYTRKELLSFLLCTLASRLFLPCVRVLAPPSSLSQIRQKIKKNVCGLAKSVWDHEGQRQGIG